jgi:hypothetical protein
MRTLSILVALIGRLVPFGEFHAAETTTTTLTELVRREAYQAGVMYFAERPGVTGFVTKADITGQDTLTARFPIYDKLSAVLRDLGSDRLHDQLALDTSGTVDVTVSEHAQRSSSPTWRSAPPSRTRSTRPTPSRSGRSASPASSDASRRKRCSGCRTRTSARCSARSTARPDRTPAR